MDLSMNWKQRCTKILSDVSAINECSHSLIDPLSELIDEAHNLNLSLPEVLNLEKVNIC